MARPAGKTIRVVIVDDHPMLREGTRVCLEREPDIAVVGVTGMGREAIHLVAEHRPDVLLLDLRLPDISGVEVARQVRAAYPDSAIVILTGYGDAGYLRALRPLGIRGYLAKTATDAEIIDAVRRAAAGYATVASLSEGELLIEPLTPREREILRRLVAGQRNAEIAAALLISAKTVEYHVSNIFTKLGARSRAEAIRIAHEQGIVLLEDTGRNQE
ncbi:Transcriptional regulatory protein LiaR [bacterium HR26]|nr:Transcriptional regulatory protein LiaR [bacterium HR26]